MGLINCPECSKEISETVDTCPHCGFKLKVTTEKKNKNTPVFQIIALVTFLIALFSPKLFISFFVLIIILSAIIALVRKEKNWGLSLTGLFLGLFLLVLPIINETQQILYKDKIKITEWRWDKEKYMTYIRGRIRNDGDKVIRYFKVKAYYLDYNGNVLDTGFDNSLEDIGPGMSKEFEIMHQFQSGYSRVKVEIDEVTIR